MTIEYARKRRLEKLCEVFSFLNDIAWEGAREDRAYCLACQVEWPHHAEDCERGIALAAVAWLIHDDEVAIAKEVEP